MSALLASNMTDLAAQATSFGGAASSRDGALAVRILSPLHLETHAAAIEALAERAIERNVFYEAPFLIHAAHHLRDNGRPQIVSIWRGADMVGLFPIVTPRFGGKARGWLSHFMTNGAPLIDLTGADQILARFLAWLGEGERPLSGALFPSIDADGAFAVLLRSFAVRRSLPVAAFGEHRRAVLRPTEAAPGDIAPSVKRRRELLRQQRRLAEAGVVATRSATSRAEVRDAFEHFLALEVKGWKGRAGTAMMQDAAAAAFARSAMRALAGEGRCRIDLLELDGAPIAATIELKAGDRVCFWKTAYDETQRRFSPGVQMALDMTGRHAAALDLSLVDSCAEADHPMIDHLWTDRMTIADIFVGCSSDQPDAAMRVIRSEEMRRRARAAAKAIYRAVKPAKAR